MDGVSKVHSGTALGQLHHRRIRCQHINTVVKNSGLGRQVTLPVQQLTQHGNFGVVSAVGAGALIPFHARFFVDPMGRHAMFSVLVHLLRANLNFNSPALSISHHGVQRLIAIDLGLGNVVVKFFGHGLKLPMNPAQGGITVAHLGYHHT